MKPLADQISLLPCHLPADQVSGSIHKLLGFVLGILRFQLTDILNGKNGNNIVRSARGNDRLDTSCPYPSEFIKDKRRGIPIRPVIFLLIISI